MKIRFLGAARKVTGSCYHLVAEGMQILVDCGMHQGREADELNRRPFRFNPAEIDCVFLTHAHLDHSGLIPRLVSEGFQGKIIATAATAELAEIMLLDAAHIQEKDAEWLQKKALRAGKEIEIAPLYDTDDVKKALPFFIKKTYEKVESLGNGAIKYRIIDAGHILGSGTLEVWYKGHGGEEKKIVFSGDVGKNENPIINDPQHIERAEYVVVESTYGNRFHKDLDASITELEHAIKDTFRRGGNVLIPSFAVGRTQDILYILNSLVKQGRLRDIDVYVDSPLADKATKIYIAHPEYFDVEAQNSSFKFRSSDGMKIHFTPTVEESQRLNKIKSGAIIMAGSGMCEGGRIRHHFKHNIWRPECSIIFTGFQVRGTLGRHIVDGAKTAYILGEEMAIRAKIFTIGGFSAHADQGELLEWLGTFTNNPEVFIVHGEESVALEFEHIVQERLGLKTHVPYLGEEIDI